MKKTVFITPLLLLLSLTIFGQSGTYRGKAESSVKTSFSEIKEKAVKFGDPEYNQFKKPNPQHVFPAHDISPDEVLFIGGELIQNTSSREVSPLPDTTFLGLEDSGNSIPPDVNGAPGPDHLMVTLNTEVRIQDRVGANLGTVSLGMFWTDLCPAEHFRPQNSLRF